MEYKVDKNKCMGCGACVVSCPRGFKFGKNNKAEVINSDEALVCEAEVICPFEAIIKIK